MLSRGHRELLSGFLMVDQHKMVTMTVHPNGVPLYERVRLKLHEEILSVRIRRLRMDQRQSTCGYCHTGAFMKAV
jgi:hypothetical protein